MEQNKYKIILKSVLYGFYLFLLCFLLANIEIQIEGPNGWAAKLPTWRNTNPNLTWIFGGRPITGYHIYLNLFLITFFHIPLLFKKISVLEELKIIYSYSILAVVWDFQWFIMNPYFGIEKYKPENIWWFKSWFLGFPIDYYFGILLSFIIFITPAIFKKAKIKSRIVEWASITITLLICTFFLTLFYS